MKKLSEDLNQIVIATYLRKLQIENDFIFFHIPNGGSRSKSEAGRFKAMGVLAGVPDLQIIAKNKAFFIELKTNTGSLGKAQKELHPRIEALGFKIYTVYGDNPIETLPKIAEIMQEECPYMKGISSFISNTLNSSFISNLVKS